MNYLSVCSGIEAASVAWNPLGWKPVAFSEIEPFPTAVLAHHYPETPNWGDMERFNEWPDANVDVLVGGTPCQSFSVAGLRGGLADPRGNLALTYLAIAERYAPRWLVWENVPGVLSSDDGRAFGALLGGMEKLGYGWAYRTLDAKHFGVPQRRRRVFVVGSLAGWAAAASVLFEPESLRGDSAPSRESKKDVAAFTPSCFGNFRKGVGTLRAEGGDLGGGSEMLIASGDVSHSLNAGGMGRQDYETETLLAYAIRTANTSANGHGVASEVSHTLDQSNGQAIAFNGRQDPIHSDISGSLDTDSHTQCVAFAQNSRDEVRLQGGNGDISGALSANEGMKQRTYVAQPHAVRRLTPVECERLQRFPDGYTNIEYRGKPASDGPRYKALGNSMAVPVVQWIGQRINEAEMIKGAA